MATTLQVPKNNATSTLAGAVNNSSDPVTFSAASGEGTRFPSTFPYPLTIDNEILSVTARTGDSLTAARAQEGTTIASHSAGATIELRVTAKFLSDLNTAVNALENKFPIASADITDGTIVSADISGSAAIPYSKLSLGTSILNADISASAAIDATKLGSGAVSNTEFGYLDGVTSALQTQLDASALLAGRSGGQTLYGGTGSGDSLTLGSTSHATKGSIFLGANSAYDGVNSRLGIGTTAPAATLQLGTGATTAVTDGGIQFGSTTPPQLYRSAANTLLLTGAAVQSFAINASGGISGVAMDTNLRVLFARTGALDIGRTSGSAIRVFNQSAGSTNASFSISNAGRLDWGDGTNAVDNNLQRIDSSTMGFNLNLQLGFNLKLTVGGSNPGAIFWASSTGHNGITIATGEATTYLKGSLFVLRYNDAGTTRYKYLDLSGTGVTWVHSTSAP